MIGIRGFFTQRHIGTEDTIFTMKIDLSKSGGTTNGFKIPFTTNQTSFPLEINWGDGNSDIITSWNQVETEHIYSTSGIYDISIIGTLDDRSFQFTTSQYKTKLIEVGGILDITDGTQMFLGCSNLSQCNISLDNLENGNNMFFGCNLTSWSVELPNLTNGFYMFGSNSLTSWTIDLPNLTNGNGMFSHNSLTSWTVELPNLTNGDEMFYYNNLISWTVELPNLTLAPYMFGGNSLTSWNVELPNLTNGFGIFGSNTINTTDYSNLLINLSSNNPNNNVTFHGGNSKYNSFAVSSRANLVSRSWIITDGGPE